MPDSNSHVKQYQHNYDLLNSQELGKAENADWAVTIAFYAAMHVIETYFAGKGQHCVSHVERNGLVACESNLRKLNIPARYNVLYNQSMRSRYKCACISVQDVRDAKDILSFIVEELNLA